MCLKKINQKTKLKSWFVLSVLFTLEKTFFLFFFLGVCNVGFVLDWTISAFKTRFSSTGSGAFPFSVRLCTGRTSAAYQPNVSRASEPTGNLLCVLNVSAMKQRHCTVDSYAFRSKYTNLFTYNRLTLHVKEKKKRKNASWLIYSFIYWSIALTSYISVNFFRAPNSRLQGNTPHPPPPPKKKDSMRYSSLCIKR